MLPTHHMHMIKLVLLLTSKGDKPKQEMLWAMEDGPVILRFCVCPEYGTVMTTAGISLYWVRSTLHDQEGILSDPNQ